MADRFFVGDMSLFLMACRDASSKPIGQRDPAELTLFCGLEVVEDCRLPRGVWALVPSGKELVDEGVRFRALAEGYEEDARQLAWACEQVRAHSLAHFQSLAALGIGPRV